LTEIPIDSNEVKRREAYAALGFCRQLYTQAKSFEAFPYAQAALESALELGDPALELRALVACGLILGDVGDIAGAIEFHMRALSHATRDGNVVEVSRTWNNIGLCFLASGNYDLATACFDRSVKVIADISAPLHSRFCAQCNLAHCHFHRGDIDAGLREAYKALHEVTEDILASDTFSVLLLRRNLVRLLLEAGRLDEAGFHLAEVVELSNRLASPRAAIATATVQAAYEIAQGLSDVALTRLAAALTESRKVPAVLRDTLACLAKAEDVAGHPESARLRLQELSDHVYDLAITRARQHIQLAPVFSQQNPPAPGARGNTRPLSRPLPSPSKPAEWDALVRLSVTASLRIDPTGWHGLRVGTLVKALALEYGLAPLDALEFGLASQFHDIGMLSVPEGIPLCSRRLNDVETELIERHSAAGAEMLAISAHPRWLLATEIAAYHHARWDGEGYPVNVAGAAIPLAARMCAVADTYDTLVTARPWRAARSMQSALRELNRVAGTQLDPALVNCFATMIMRETEDIGIDASLDPALNGFQALLDTLSLDRGFS
jgi:HD-GYP domain-containing protein (c-di-GMP phosphodiesterase class II)